MGTRVGSIGEHAGRVRAAIVERLGVLGLDPVSDREPGGDRVLAAASSAGPRTRTQGPPRPAVLRVEAREDLVIAREVEVFVPAE